MSKSDGAHGSERNQAKDPGDRPYRRYLISGEAVAAQVAPRLLTVLEESVVTESNTFPRRHWRQRRQRSSNRPQASLSLCTTRDGDFIYLFNDLLFIQHLGYNCQVMEIELK